MSHRRGHKAKCDCEWCKNPDTAQHKEDEAMRQYGWVCHFVGDAPNATGIDCHTHGLPEHFGHKNLQVILPAPPELIHGILCFIVNEINGGRRFEEGEHDLTASDGKVLRVGIIPVTDERGEELSRVVLPDPKGHVGKGEIEAPFDVQHDTSLKAARKSMTLEKW